MNDKTTHNKRKESIMTNRIMGGLIAGACCVAAYPVITAPLVVAGIGSTLSSVALISATMTAIKKVHFNNKQKRSQS